MLQLVTQLVLFSAIAVVLPSGLAQIDRWNRMVPKVVLWMILGVAIGTFSPWLFTTDPKWYIAQIGFVGLQLFGLATGMHLDPAELRQSKKVGILGMTSFLIPGALGMLFSLSFLWLFPDIFVGYQGFIILAICGVFTGVTALPVLSAILGLMGLSKTKLGKTNLTMATLHDFILWPLVGVITVVSGSHGGHGNSNVWLNIAFIVIYLIVMFVPIRRVLEVADRYLNDKSRFVIVLVLMALSSIVTEELGLHYLLGAVVAGAILPRTYKHATHWIEKPTLHYLLPFFVVSAGFGISLTTLKPAVWIMFGTLCVANLIGQFFGSYVSAKMLGYPKSEAMAITSFMTCKGIVELALAKLLYTSHVIPEELYVAAVLMAITLTAITAPWARIALRGLPELNFGAKLELAPVPFEEQTD